MERENALVKKVAQREEDSMRRRTEGYWSDMSRKSNSRKARSKIRPAIEGMWRIISGTRLDNGEVGRF